MRNSFAVCSLAVALCLVICDSVNAEVSKETATREVGEAKQAVTAVHERAQSEFTNANLLLQRVESSKTRAEDAKVKSQKAPQDNTDAVAIANIVKRLSDEVDNLYATEKPKLNNAVDTLTLLLSEAEKLNGKPDIKIEPDTESSQDYTKTNGEAAALKLEATKLNGQIDVAIEPIARVGAKADEMETKTKKAQIKDAHVSVIVAVEKIKTMLGKADDIIPQIEAKEREVSSIAEKMQKDCTTELTQSNEVIKEQFQIANDALKSAKGAVQNAKDARTAIQTQKDTADEALTKVKEDNKEVSDAKNEASTAEECVRAAQLIVPKFNSELLKAETSVTNANDAKQKLVEALEKATSQKSTEQSKEKEETNLPVVEGTDSQNKDTTIQPTSKELPSPSDNSTEEIKQILSSGVQNVPTTPLTGGKAAAPGAKNDSAMTVSVPLLVALIASAFLQ